MTTDAAPTLPGMEPTPAGQSPIEAAAARQIAALDSQGLLDDSHAVVVALIYDLAGVIGSAAGRGRASAVALASKELREALALLPQAVGDADPFSALQRDLAAADAQARARAAQYLGKP